MAQALCTSSAMVQYSIKIGILSIILIQYSICNTVCNTVCNTLYQYTVYNRVCNIHVLKLVLPIHDIKSRHTVNRH